MNKYKLIHNQTKEEHLCDKVTIDGFDYYVSDEEIFENDFYLNMMFDDNYKIEICLPKNRYEKDGKLLFYPSKNLDCYKIIATNNSNIDIPKVEEFEII